MPPKRKVPLSSRTASTPPGDAVEQAEKETPAPIKEGLGVDQVISDAWTDEQETSLFKSMIRWKPVGTLDCFHYLTTCADNYCQACISTFGWYLYLRIWGIMATSLLRMLIHGYQGSGRNWVVCIILRRSMQESVSQGLGFEKHWLIPFRKTLSANLSI